MDAWMDAVCVCVCVCVSTILYVLPQSVCLCSPALFDVMDGEYRS